MSTPAIPSPTPTPAHANHTHANRTHASSILIPTLPPCPKPTASPANPIADPTATTLPRPTSTHISARVADVLFRYDVVFFLDSDTAVLRNIDHVLDAFLDTPAATEVRTGQGCLMPHSSIPYVNVNTQY